MKSARRLLPVVLVVVLVAAGLLSWYSYGQRSQAAGVTEARGLQLLDAIARQVHENYLQPSIADQKLYQGATKGMLAAGGPTCTRAVNGTSLVVTPQGVKASFIGILRRVLEQCAKRPEETERLFYGAAKGMLESLGDPYSGFMDPEAYRFVRQEFQGFFYGVGMYIEVNKTGKLIVVQPIEGTPAARAGVRSGDYITTINGVSTAGMTSQEAAARIRGPKGTAVNLTIRRGERVFDVTIVRDRIEILGGEGPNSLDPETRKLLQQMSIGYIRLTAFNERTAKAFDQLYAEAKRTGARGLLLDLRNNPGGLLNISLDLLNRFVPAGQPTVHTVDRNGRRETERATRRSKVDIPVVVLVNEFTASASEIVSGALQDHGIAPLVGVKTFGKGVIQTIVDLPLSSGAAITTAKYLTPNGRDIHGKGLVPDVVVGESEEALRQRLAGRPESEVDQQLERMKAEQLQRAVEILKRKMTRSEQQFMPGRATGSLTPTSLGAELAAA